MAKPTRKAPPSRLTAKHLVPYPRALQELRDRCGATADDIAGWVHSGPQEGGLTAYFNRDDGRPPVRFSFLHWQKDPRAHDYKAALMWTWFSEQDLQRFVPKERYIGGGALIERWSSHPGIDPRAFLQAKHAELRLEEVHPVMGLSRETLNDPDFPTLEDCLFSMAQVKEIEANELVGIRQQDRRSDTDSDGDAASEAQRERFERAKRLLDRKRELKRQGVRNYLRRIADEEGRSTRRVAKIIALVEKNSFYDQLVLGAAVPIAEPPRLGKSKARQALG